MEKRLAGTAILKAPLCALLLAGALAHAQTDSSVGESPEAGNQAGSDRTGMLEEVMVTARKRSESFLDVPVSMQVFNSEDIERYGVSDLIELSELASQVQLFPSQSGAGGNFIIRGISATSLDPGVDTSVAINLDGMAINRGRIIRQAMFDLEAVEILKGPQALFFGKNSPAGVISINSAGPTDEWEFTAKGFYEFEAREVIGELTASGPINDQLGIRVAYSGSDAEGFLKNNSVPTVNTFPSLALEPYDFPGASESRLGGYEQHMARITLQYDPSDDFSATLKVLSSTMEGDGSGSHMEIVQCADDVPTTAGLPDFSSDCKLNHEVSSGAIPEEIRQGFGFIEGLANGGGYTEYESTLVTLNLQYEGDNYSLTSQTGFHSYDWFRWDNFDGSTFNQLNGAQPEEQETFSQEIRLLSTFDGPVNFMAGGFYETMERDIDSTGKIAALGPDPITGFTNTWETTSTTEGDSYSVFGQLIWDITDDLEFTGGARWTKEDRRAASGIVYSHAFVGFLFSTPGEMLRPEFNDTNVSPEATLTWSVNDDLSIYAAYKTGYKSGGFSTQNIISAGLTADDIIYTEEEADGGEIGLKSELQGGRLRFNATAYYYSFDGVQDSVFNAPTVSFSVINSDVKTQGIEADFTWAASDKLMLRGQAGYNDSKYRDFANAPCWAGQTAAEGCIANTTGLGGPDVVQDLSGTTRLNAPEIQGSAGFSYETTLGNNLNLGFSSDVIYSDGWITSVANTPGSDQSSITKINASIRLSAADDSWELALIGRNLTDELYVSNTADRPGGIRSATTGRVDVYGQSIRARQIGLQATFRF